MKVRKGMKIKREYKRGENIFESQRERERNEGGKKEEWENERRNMHEYASQTKNQEMNE